MLRVYISPNPSQIDGDNGVGKVVHAQFRYLPQFDIDLVEHPEDADVIAGHVYGDYLPRLDVLHLHGAYWTGDKGSGTYLPVHLDANTRIIESCRRAKVITMPSQWAGEFLRRDMRLTPVVIPNGVDLKLWQSQGQEEPAPVNMGYVLWNKNRAGDVCDPSPALDLALRSGANVLSTFAPPNAPYPLPANFKVIGKQPFEKMRKCILHANAYLSTTKECFSLSVLEAMAAGVPVLGFAWGGNLEAVRHKVDGYLVQPGDYEGLVEGLNWINENREQLSQNCRERAEEFSWPVITGRYAELYRQVYEERIAQQHRVAIVITNYNYGRYLDETIKSAANQTRPPDEIILVDDGSTDNSAAILDNLPTEYQGVGIKVVRQPNMGVAAARNNGIAATQAEYIVCLDADDKLTPRYVETLLPALKSNPTLGVVWSKLGLMAEDGRPLNQVWDFDFSWEEQTDPYNFKNGIPAGAMFRRAMWERTGGYKQCYHPAEDAEFWIRGLSVGYKARRVSDEPLFSYRMHEGSASQTKEFPPIHTWHTWAFDKQYPAGAPARTQPLIRSYSQPLVTIVTPVGPGHEKLLPTALESLLGQDFRAWEIVVVNDSRADLSQVLKPYPFVRLLETKGGGGASHARNLGLNLVRTPLVLWLDADDYIVPGALGKMVKTYAVNQGSKYVYTDWLSVNGKELTPFQAPEYSQEGWLENGLHAVTVLMEADQARAVGGFDESLTGWEDWDFFIKCAIKGFCGVRLPEPLLGYRVQTGQRREGSQKVRKNLLTSFQEKYGKYFSSKEGRGPEMAKSRCCGGNGSVVLVAKGLIEELAGAQEGQANGSSGNGGTVELEYIGSRVAPVTYHGEHGRRYQAGNNENNKKIPVHPEDVQRLEATGQFKRA